ncbi:MAG TPA: sigma-70 family RNA polymerase sigma factor [Egibacteraceae bacterium]|nr:sigma-70 family RNA polymerase sigma factor [Egibacteraceae bacterium]
MRRQAVVMLDPSSDGQPALLARAAAGDEHAVSQLYDLYAAPLYGFALRRLSDPELAQELVQNVMTRMWQLADRYDESRASVRTWVFTIARTAVIDLHRRRSRHAPVAEFADRADQRDELDRLLRAEMMRVALERLTPDHREVLDLAFFAGLTQADVAERLAVPLGTVKSRTYYALKALRLACDELGVVE